MKTTIKKLSADISKVLKKNAEANYYNGLIDCGEWSQTQTGPDFSNLIKRWKLNRRRLCLWTWIAWDYATEFQKHFPRSTHGYDPKKGPYILNPWQEIAENLQEVFMAGFLIPVETYECPKCKRMMPQKEFLGGLCKDCDREGYWMDPVGGIHFDDPNSDEFDDPASMYE